MWDKDIGRKGERLFVIGTSDVPLYLYRLDDGWALFEGGLAIQAPKVREQLRELVSDPAELRYWFLTHAHYDHCALPPYLLRYFPNATLVVSRAGKRTLQSWRAQDVIRTLNFKIAREMNPKRKIRLPETQTPDVWDDITLSTIDDGDSFSISQQVKVRAIATPGHSRCSMAYLIEPDNVLLISDSFGEIVSDRTFLPLVFDDPIEYECSINRLVDVRPDIVGLGHHGILRGDLASSAAADALSSFYQFRAQLLSRVSEGGPGPSAFVKELSRRYAAGSSGFLPADLFNKSMYRMIDLLT